MHEDYSYNEEENMSSGKEFELDKDNEVSKGKIWFLKSMWKPCYLIFFFLFTCSERIEKFPQTLLQILREK